MTIKELKDWLSSLPEEKNEYKVVVRNFSDGDDDTNIKYQDVPFVFSVIDDKGQYLQFIDVKSYPYVEKIRKSISEQPKND